jgi:hypothetical protein
VHARERVKRRNGEIGSAQEKDAQRRAILRLRRR